MTVIPLNPRRGISPRQMLEHWIAQKPGCSPEQVKELEGKAREAVAHIDSAFELDEAREYAERKAQAEAKQAEWEVQQAEFEKDLLPYLESVPTERPFVPQKWSPRERHDKVLYDTHVVPARERVLFFGSKNIGYEFRTNMVTAGSLPSDNTFVILALGMRLLGKTKDEEDLLLDHLRVELSVGDKPQHDILGPQASMLRNGFLEGEDLKTLESREFPLWKSEWEYQGDLIKRHDSPVRVGYHFVKPIVIPVRANFPVYVSADKEFPKGVNVRIQLFGLQTRDMA